MRCDAAGEVGLDKPLRAISGEMWHEGNGHHLCPHEASRATERRRVVSSIQLTGPYTAESDGECNFFHGMPEGLFESMLTPEHRMEDDDECDSNAPAAGVAAESRPTGAISGAAPGAAATAATLHHLY